MTAAENINKITLQTATYAGAVIAGVQAAQYAAPDAPGISKQSAVVSHVLDGIDVGSQALETSPNATVASVALLVNLVVSIFKTLKHPAFIPAQGPAAQ